MGEPVLCPACKKPVLVQEWGGVVRIGGELEYIHSNIDCLLWLVEQRKKEGVQTDKDTKRENNKRLDDG